MDVKEKKEMKDTMNVYGYEVGVLTDENDENYMVCNRELPYGFYNESFGYFLDKDLKRKLDHVKKYVKEGGNDSYGIISRQGEAQIGSEYYEEVEEDEVDENLDFSFFTYLEDVEYSIRNRNGVLEEYFLEDELKKLLVKKMDKDVDIGEIGLIKRAEYALKANHITTLKQLLEIPLSGIKNINHLEDKAFNSIRQTLGRIDTEFKEKAIQDESKKEVDANYLSEEEFEALKSYCDGELWCFEIFENIRDINKYVLREVIESYSDSESKQVDYAIELMEELVYENKGFDDLTLFSERSYQLNVEGRELYIYFNGDDLFSVINKIRNHDDMTNNLDEKIIEAQEQTSKTNALGEEVRDFHESR